MSAPTARTIRLAIGSDFHLEFDRRARAKSAGSRSRGHPQIGPDLREVRGAGVDLVVLAGDIDVGLAAIRYADQVASYLATPVLFVPGNHEFYGTEMPQLLEAMRAAAAGTGVSVLDGDRIDWTIRGLRVAALGATLWTDYSLGMGVPEDERKIWLNMELARAGLTDHRAISWHHVPFQPGMAFELHQMARAWLAGEAPAARETADFVIMATHHAPTPRGLAPHHRKGDLAPAFASDMTPKIRAWKPDLWVFGHTHHACDFRMGRTRLVSAPRGYLGAEPGAAEYKPAVIQL